MGKNSQSSDDEDKPFWGKQWVGCDIEATYFGEERKLSKQERKMASAKDRSKYKKTDQDKLQKRAELKQQAGSAHPQALRGRVLSITPQGILVEYEGKNVVCTLRGALKKEKNLLKNLVTVGDFVRFDKMNEEEGIIVEVEPRQSVLSRADNLSRRKEQLIAANIDQVLITVSVVSPELKPSLVDRYIIAALKGQMRPIIVVNKIDLLEEDSERAEVEREMFQMLLDAYEKAQIPVVAVSVEKEMGLEDLKAVMKDKASVFSGQSGVGKSSLINAVTGLNLRTGKVVDRTKKGSHTTTTTQLVPLTFGGWCIDTPGIKSFGVWDLKKEELEKYFSEIHAYARQCKFPSCRHLHEDGCAVMQAVEEETISPLRYESYQMLMQEIDEEYLRR